MFVVTFYSYKGGVGRTMALVNVAADLARKGKKVLVVDFDLEAPSLPNYGFLSSCARNPGLVDYIAAYRTDGMAPDASGYIYKCIHDDISLWVMPSGDTSKSTYSTKLASIDWNKLYKHEKGFLFFEDLKQQWKDNEELGFDYVLIDSRTGHTDVGGICTRQLPDLVVAMFLPTMQNISGLTPIVKEIRGDKSREMRPVDILFCASNVPNLDDEQFILSGLLDCAAERLSFDKKGLKTIHHYASLDVLSHAIFSIYRPNSRLSREYLELEHSIIAYNFSDPDGALLALKAIRLEVRRAAQGPKAIQREEVATKVDTIFTLHPGNKEIARTVSHIRSMIGDIEGEIDALTAAIDAGDDLIALRGMRARAYQAISLKERSEEDLRYILENEDASSVEITTALQMLRGTKEGIGETIASLLNRSNLSLSVLNSLSEFILRDRHNLSGFADRLHTALNEGSGTAREISSAKLNLMLSLIGSGRFKEAVFAWKKDGTSQPEDIPEMFNFFIARWAGEGSPDLALAEAIIAQMSSIEDRTDANFLQCFAVLKAITGKLDDALSLLERAEARARTQKGRIFSCASYLYRTPNEFISDCERLLKEIVEKRVIELQLGKNNAVASI